MCDPTIEPSVYTQRWRRARKQHACCTCREPIAIGDLYHFVSGIWDGESDSFKHCARCWRLYELLCEAACYPDEYPPLNMRCGSRYDGDDERIYELAFWTKTEAQAWARTEAT